MVNSDLVNPTTRTVEGDFELIEQNYRLRGLASSTTYFLKLSASPPCPGTPQPPHTAISFTTPGAGTDRSSQQPIVEDKKANGNKTISIVPNPNTGEFEVVLPAGSSFEEIELYDMAGRLLKKHAIGQSGHIIRIEANWLPAGTYLLRAIGSRNSGPLTTLFVVQP